MASSETEHKSASGGAGRVIFLEGRGELPMLEVSTAWSTAEIYLQGAHVTHFTKKNEPPLLFVSQCSRFAAGSLLFSPGLVHARDWDSMDSPESRPGS